MYKRRRVVQHWARCELAECRETALCRRNFGEGYNDGVETWAEQTCGDGEKSLRAMEPMTRASFDTNISVYADDIWRTGIMTTFDKAQAQVEAWDECIDTQLQLRDMGQNRGKKNTW